MSNINQLVQESMLGKIGKAIVSLTLGGVALYYFLTNKGELTPEVEEIIIKKTKIDPEKVQEAFTKLLENPPVFGDIQKNLEASLKELGAVQKDIDKCVENLKNMPSLGFGIGGKK